MTSTLVTKVEVVDAGAFAMRRLENEDEDKFWEAWVKDDLIFCYKYGKIGSNGHIKLKKFKTRAEADAELEEKLAEKLGEGFVEVGEGAPAAKLAPAAAKPAAASAGKPAAAPAGKPAAAKSKAKKASDDDDDDSDEDEDEAPARKPAAAMPAAAKSGAAKPAAANDSEHDSDDEDESKDDSDDEDESEDESEDDQSDDDDSEDESEDDQSDDDDSEDEDDSDDEDDSEDEDDSDDDDDSDDEDDSAGDSEDEDEDSPRKARGAKRPAAKPAAKPAAAPEPPPKPTLAPRVVPRLPTPERIARATESLVALKAAVGGRSWKVGRAARKARFALESVGGLELARHDKLTAALDDAMALAIAPKKRLPLEDALVVLWAVDGKTFARVVNHWRAKMLDSSASASIGILAATVAGVPDAELAAQVATALVDRRLSTAAFVRWFGRLRPFLAEATKLDAFLATLKPGSDSLLSARVEAARQ